MDAQIVLSRFEIEPLQRARREGQNSAQISLDLGLSGSQVLLEPDGVVLPDGQRLSWESIGEISENETVCFEVVDSTEIKIHRFSESLNRFYSLMPTGGAPTILISGIPMHRVKGIDPHRDTLTKIRTIAPIAGRVLDTCTGLGYTAIEAAKTAEQVITIELDPTVLEIARLNPWSRELFAQSRIQQVVGDAYDEVQGFEDESFSCIIHDPPMFSLSGDLYSGKFYRDLYRILRHRGRLFHYVGDLKSRSGRNVVRGVVRRLGEVGFGRIVRKPGAFGVVAYKS